MDKVLVIDDQDDIIEMVTYMLTEAGYAVEGATSGEEGLAVARRFRPDLILCDIMMPGVDGYGVLEAARQNLELATTPFVFLTAKTDPDEVRTGMELGADDYLTKPFSERALVRAVETQLDKHVRRRERYQQQLEMLRKGLSSMLPHELRTPLTLILAHASLLIDDYDAATRSEIFDSLHTIKDAASRLNRLVENMLVYVTLEGDATVQLEHPFTPDVREVVDDAARRTAAHFNRADDLEVTAVEGAVQMHPFHLKKIVEELVDNAFKFSEAGESVHVAVLREAGTLCLRVTDRGAGMTDEQLERVGPFIQFNRDRLEQQGSGMGLAVARRLVELYRGTLDIDSEPDRYTTVRVHVPDAWTHG